MKGSDETSLDRQLDPPELSDAALQHVGRFNHLWASGCQVQPLVVVVGGTAGVGKSTLARALTQFVPAFYVIPTSLIRTLLRATQPGDPLHFQHTYELTLEEFVRQSRAVMSIVQQLIAFTRTEKQLYVIEGSNVIPGVLGDVNGVDLVEVYLEVPSQSRHRTMVAGPTHNRALGEAEFAACRAIQSFLVGEARARGKPVLDSDRALACTMSLLEERLSRRELST